MQSIINLKLFSISNNVRIAFLGLSSALIINLYIKILYLLLFTFLKIKLFHNFVNYKTNLALFNTVKIEKFEYIYINIYLIQICQIK